MVGEGSGPKDLVDVSVANLITELEYGDQILPFAVRHPSDSNKPLQALSAGPKFPLAAQLYLVDEFDVDPAGFAGDDARCRIPVDKVSDLIKWLDDEYYRGDQAVMDWSPVAELGNRLTTPYWQEFPSPLRCDSLNSLSLVELGLFRQPPQENESERGGRGAKVRVFRKWCLIFQNRKTAHDMLRSLAVIPLTREELLTTRGGSCIGWAGGYRLANNLGVEDW